MGHLSMCTLIYIYGFTLALLIIFRVIGHCKSRRSHSLIGKHVSVVENPEITLFLKNSNGLFRCTLTVYVRRVKLEVDVVFIHGFIK